MPLNQSNLNQILIDLKPFPKAQLMIVTKNQTSNDIQKLISQKFKIFGENRVQEAYKKFSKLRSGTSLELHLIGPLQTNKVKLALNTFDVIQSVDRPKLVDEIMKFHVSKRFYIQINIGQEPQKNGVDPDKFEDLYAYCLEKKMKIEGIMCIPPNERNPQIYFKKMNDLKDAINPNLKLSMGTSSDYIEALKMNSNYIRVGSLIFSS